MAGAFVAVADEELSIDTEEAPKSLEWFGPRPSLIRARESGVIFVCQPLTAPVLPKCEARIAGSRGA